MSPNIDKGKGKEKAVEGKVDETKKGKDVQPQANGKKADDKADGRLHFIRLLLLPAAPDTAIFSSLANLLQRPRN